MSFHVIDYEFLSFKSYLLKEDKCLILLLSICWYVINTLFYVYNAHKYNLGKGIHLRTQMKFMTFLASKLEVVKSEYISASVDFNET